MLPQVGAGFMDEMVGSFLLLAHERLREGCR
jgi:hypothetical protein